MIGPQRRVFQWDPYINPDEGDMEFRLTYAGRLLAHTTNARLRERGLHVHEIRKEFHKQLKVLWSTHPVLQKIKEHGSSVFLYVGSGAPPLN